MEIKARVNPPITVTAPPVRNADKAIARSIIFPPDLLEFLRTEAFQNRLSVTAMVTKICEDYRANKTAKTGRWFFADLDKEELSAGSDLLAKDIETVLRFLKEQKDALEIKELGAGYEIP